MKYMLWSYYGLKIFLCRMALKTYNLTTYFHFMFEFMNIIILSEDKKSDECGTNK